MSNLHTTLKLAQDGARSDVSMKQLQGNRRRHYTCTTISCMLIHPLQDISVKLDSSHLLLGGLVRSLLRPVSNCTNISTCKQTYIHMYKTVRHQVAGNTLARNPSGPDRLNVSTHCNICSGKIPTSQPKDARFPANRVRFNPVPACNSLFYAKSHSVQFS